MLPVTVKFSHWLPKLFKSNAVTIGHTIYIDSPKSTDYRMMVLFCHECQHVKQVEKAGSTFNFLYSYFFQWIRHGFDYSKIPYEVQAYAVQGSPLDVDESREWTRWFV